MYELRQAIQNGAKFSRLVRRYQNQTTVTNGWNVGASITYPKTGREIRLSLFRVLPSGRFFNHPEYDGMLFSDEATMDAWRLDHGFIVPHFHAGWCPVHRVQHRWCHSRVAGCAVSGGYAYDGCEDAQARWDAEDWTWSKRTCADCGEQKWEPNWLQDVSREHHGRTICRECVKALDTVAA